MTQTLIVTGGIGSGKSLVCSLFAAKGVHVYDSDSMAKALYDNDPALVARISHALGHGLCDSRGLIDRKKLASVVFSDPAMLSILESIVHPAVMEDFLEWKSALPSEPFVIMESAIYLEKKMFHVLADKVLVVDAPYNLRLERACRRDGVHAETIRTRMERQKLLNDISDGLVVPEADYVIVNDGPVESLQVQVDLIYTEMSGERKND